MRASAFAETTAARGRKCWLAVPLAAMLVAPVPNLAAAELVMFETDGCVWCIAWDREIGQVYRKTEEGQRAPLRRVELTAPRPADLRHLEGITSSPTFVLMEGGSEVGRIVGYPGENFFWPTLQELLAKLPEAPGKQGGRTTP